LFVKCPKIIKKQLKNKILSNSIMKTHNERQLTKFLKLREKYGDFIRVNNVCVFRSKNKAVCVNIDLHLIEKYIL